jgi:D-hexose-6-phosphate mutarotase
VTGAIPIHGFMSRTDQWQVVDVNADGKAAWVTSRLDHEQAGRLDEAVGPSRTRWT